MVNVQDYDDDGADGIQDSVVPLSHAVNRIFAVHYPDKLLAPRRLRVRRQRFDPTFNLSSNFCRDSRFQKTKCDFGISEAIERSHRITTSFELTLRAPIAREVPLPE